MNTQTSTLEYFMAHAPAEPQDWFEPVMPTERPQFTNPGLAEQPDHEVQEITNWNNERYKQRYIQWPLAWAQEQCKMIPALLTGPITLTGTKEQTKSVHYNKAEHGSKVTEWPPVDELLKFISDQRDLPSNSPYNKSMFGWVYNQLMSQNP